jgi:hypothetical protein
VEKLCVKVESGLLKVSQEKNIATVCSCSFWVVRIVESERTYFLKTKFIKFWRGSSCLLAGENRFEKIAVFNLTCTYDFCEHSTCWNGFWKTY